MDADSMAKLATLGIPQELWDRVRIEKDWSDPPWTDAEHPDFSFRITGVDYDPPDPPPLQLREPLINAFGLDIAPSRTQEDRYPGLTPMFPGQPIIGRERESAAHPMDGGAQFWASKQPDDTMIFLAPPFLAVWSVEVLPYGSPMTGEMRWHPDRGLTKHTTWADEIDPLVAAAVFSRVDKGLRMWLASPNRLRGGGPKEKTEEEHRAEYDRLVSKAKPVYDGVIERNGKITSRDDKFTQEVLAGVLGISDRQVRRILKENHKKWGELLSTLADAEDEGSLS